MKTPAAPWSIIDGIIYLLSRRDLATQYITLAFKNRVLLCIGILNGPERNMHDVPFCPAALQLAMLIGAVVSEPQVSGRLILAR